MFRRSSRRHGHDRGASIVELAILAPVLILIVMGTLDLARGYRMQIQLESAAGEGAAFARIYPDEFDCPGDEDIVGVVLEADPDLASLQDFRVVVMTENVDGDLLVPVTGCRTMDVEDGSRIRVDVIATFDVATPMVERVTGETIEITGSTEVVVQRG